MTDDLRAKLAALLDSADARPPARDGLPTGNRNYDESIVMSSPTRWRDLAIYSKELQLALNANLPLEAKTLTATSAPISLYEDVWDPDSAARAGAAVNESRVEFRFFNPAFIYAVTGVANGIVINAPSATEDAPFVANGVAPYALAPNPAASVYDELEIKWRKQNGEVFSIGDTNDFAPWRSIVGNSERPYVLGLVQYMMPAENLVMTVRVPPARETSLLDGSQPLLRHVQRVSLTLHYLQLPTGTVVG